MPLKSPQSPHVRLTKSGSSSTYNRRRDRKKDFFMSFFSFHRHMSKWWMCYHDSILAVPHDNNASFRLQLKVDSVFLHLDPWFVIRHFDTSKEQRLWLECQSNWSRHGNRRALTKCRRQSACFWRGERKAPWCRQSNDWLSGFRSELSSWCAPRTPGRTRGSRTPGCTRTNRRTGRHRRQTSWSALCPMCCRCCWHGCELQMTVKQKKHVTELI